MSATPHKKDEAALAILCQGYLLAFSDLHGNPDFAPTDAGFDDFKQALGIMGLRKDTANDLEALMSLSDIKPKRQLLSTSGWWSDPFETSDSLLPVSSVGSSTANLVAKIRDGSEISPELVAGTYLELVAVLGPAGDETALILPNASLHLLDKWDSVV